MAGTPQAPMKQLTPTLMRRLVFATAVAGEIMLFEYPDFGGGRITLRGAVSNLDPSGFNDRAASMASRSATAVLHPTSAALALGGTRGAGEPCSASRSL